jgi:hypothetical protein
MRWKQLTITIKEKTEMKDILIEQDDTLLEPLKSIAELAACYGLFPSLKAIYELLEFQREQIAHCAKCYRKTELLYAGLGQLLLAYERQFPPRVEVVGEGLIQ